MSRALETLAHLLAQNNKSPDRWVTLWQIQSRQVSQSSVARLMNRIYKASYQVLHLYERFAVCGDKRERKRPEKEKQSC